MSVNRRSTHYTSGYNLFFFKSPIKFSINKIMLTGMKDFIKAREIARFAAIGKMYNCCTIASCPSILETRRGLISRIKLFKI